MFGFQSMKRAREDDSDSDDERYLKRSRPWLSHGFHNSSANYPSSNLPFRLSLPPSPPRMVPNLDAMTPNQSEHSEANSPASIQDDHIQFSSPTNADVDMDLDMDEDDFDIVGSQPPDSPFIMRPPKLNLGHDSPVNNTGRIPTPIYPTFHAPRSLMSTGGISGLGYPSGGLAGSIGIGNGNLGVPCNTILQTPPVPRKQSQADIDRSRRMPSPISEDEDIPDTPTALTQSQLSRLSVTSIAEHMDAEMAPPPGVAAIPTRGRKRSGALSGKGRFSMGYRDDCEKCRQRVPGHYSHFL